MRFDKVVLYDFSDDPLSDEFLDRLRQRTSELEVVYADGDYTGKLSAGHLEGADGLVSRVFDDYPQELFRGSSLDYIGVMATDSSHYPEEVLEEESIEIKAVSDYATESVAELTLSMLLNLSLRTMETAEFVGEGGWKVGPFPGKELKGKTLGIAGLGRIGSRVAELADSFGMEIIYHSRSEKEWAGKNGYSYVEMDTLCKKSDAVALHCSLNQETRNILSAERLEMLPDGAIVLNAAREELQDIDRTIKLCREGRIKVWFDALEESEKRQKLLSTANAVLTSHSGCATEEAQQRLRERTIDNLDKFLKQM